MNRSDQARINGCRGGRPRSQSECTCDRPNEPDDMKHKGRCLRYRSTYERRRQDALRKDKVSKNDNDV